MNALTYYHYHRCTTRCQSRSVAASCPSNSQLSWLIQHIICKCYFMNLFDIIRYSITTIERQKLTINVNNNFQLFIKTFVDCNWRIATSCNCSEEVNILARGKQQPGIVSTRVGLLCVRRGFMYLLSNPPQMRASQAFSEGAPLRLGVPPSSTISYSQKKKKKKKKREKIIFIEAGVALARCGEQVTIEIYIWMGVVLRGWARLVTFFLDANPF